MTNVKNLFELANKGDANAQYELGKCYLTGEAKADELFKEAALCLKAEAERGDTMAMYHLGSHYSRDDLNIADPDEANKWYTMAIDGLRAMAEGDNAEAQYFLAECYKEGHGVEASMDEALRLYHLAADRGHARSQAAFGLEYVLLKDYDKSMKYLTLAARHGSPRFV